MNVTSSRTWRGVPFLQWRNAWIHIALLLLPVGISASFALALWLSTMPFDERSPGMLKIGLVLASTIQTLVGFAYFVFFWFRSAANTYLFRQHLYDHSFTSRMFRIWNPFYSWRKMDVAREGHHNWALAIEGFIGMLVAFQVFWWGMKLSRYAGVAP